MDAADAVGAVDVVASEVMHAVEDRRATVAGTTMVAGTVASSN